MHNKIIGFIFISIICFSCNNVVRVNDQNNDEKQIIRQSDLEESENYYGIETCEDGEELAMKDIENGNIKYIFSSFGSRQDLPKNLESLYGIEIINVSGVLGKPNKCYNDIMYREIQRKFGKDAFNKAME
jgi:hypothetical protein